MCQIKSKTGQFRLNLRLKTSLLFFRFDILILSNFGEQFLFYFTSGIPESIKTLTYCSLQYKLNKVFF